MKLFGDTVLWEKLISIKFSGLITFKMHITNIDGL